MTKVSVILPNYNHEKYLEERIESILKQTFQNFEIIILDDCSKDKSLEIIKSYKDNLKIIEVLINKVNSGSTFRQWQKGLNLANGKYIWIAESDDFAEYTFLEKTVDYLDNHSDSHVVGVDSNLVDSEGLILQKGYGHLCYNLENTSELNGQDFFLTHMTIGNSFSNASAVLFRKEVINFDLSVLANYKLCGDWIFWSLIALKGNVGIIPECLSNFRQHPKSVRNTINLIEEKEEIIRALDFILHLAKLNDPFKQQVYNSYFNQFRNNGFEYLYLRNAMHDPTIWQKKWKYLKYQFLKKLMNILS